VSHYRPTPQWQLRKIVQRLERISSELGNPQHADAIQAHADGLAELAEQMAQLPTGLNALTPQQGKVLAFIRQFIAQRGQGPTNKEISEAFGFSSANAAQEHLRALERKGMITRTGMARGIRVNKRIAEPQA
jgi:X-X-X-Leu-X-X-Gly heptad repeat protein